MTSVEPHTPPPPAPSGGTTGPAARLLVLIIGSADAADVNFRAMGDEVGRGLPTMWGSNRDVRNVAAGDWLLLVQSNLGRAVPTAGGKWFGPYVIAEVGAVSGRAPVSWSTPAGRHDGGEWNHVWQLPTPMLVDTGQLPLAEFTHRLHEDLGQASLLPAPLRDHLAELDAGAFATVVAAQIGNKPGQLLPVPPARPPRPTSPTGGSGVTTMSPAEDVTRLLERFHNVVVEGVPGTGKSHLIDQVAEALIGTAGLGDPARNTTTLVLHPSTTYEVFVEGLRASVDPAPRPTPADGDPPAGGSPVEYGGADPRDDGTASGQRGVSFADVYATAAEGSVTFRPLPGAFVRTCLAALDAPDERFLVVLDELNRANVPQVLGDLLLCIESSKRVGFVGGQPDPDRTGRSVALQYSGAEFFVPDNVYVLATMNTADRSVAPLDAALRRRFAFTRLEPLTPEALAALVDPALDLASAGVAQWQRLNAALQAEVGPDATLGHSYFFDMVGPDGDVDPASTWRYQLLPQLIDALSASDALAAVGTAPAERATYPQLAAAIDALNAFTRPLGFELRVDGRGLDQAAVVVDVATAP